jgi:hypothetical protein
VAGGGQGGGEGSADATGADDAHPEGVGHVFEPFVPVPPTTLGQGPVWVPDGLLVRYCDEVTPRVTR